MRCFRRLLLPLTAFAGCTAMLAQAPYTNVGRPATPEEIRTWDILVAPDGKGLPPGSGTAKEGANVFLQKCAACHGKTAEGGAEKALVGGKGTLNTPQAEKTVGNYWPYATTVWDYINRSMPENKPGSLTPNEVYAITAYLFYRSDIIKEDDVMDAKTLPKVLMPNRDGFVPAVPVWPPAPGNKKH